MEQKKTVWLERVLPCLYALGQALVSIYLALRVRRWLNLVLGAETGLVVGAVFLLYFCISIRMGSRNLVAGSRVCTYISGVSAFWVIYLFMAVLTCDLVRLLAGLTVKDTASRQQLFLICGWICLLFLICATAAAVRQKNRVRVVEAPVHIKNFTGQYRIALLSDLHIGYYVGARHIRKVVEATNRLHPDMVVISGDMINAGNTGECPEIHEVERLLAGLKSREGTFAVTGNHDPAVTDLNFQQFLRQSHITLLEDDIYTNQRFNLVGRATRTRPRQSLEKLKEGTDKALPDIVLDHDPLGIREAEAAGESLIMCGHTHRGQVFPLGLFCRLMYSREEFWGQSKTGDTNAIVTAGAGYFSMPMRLGSACEIWSVDVDSNL